MEANTNTNTTEKTKMTKEEYNAKKRERYRNNEEARLKHIQKVIEYKAQHKEAVSVANKTYYEKHKEELLTKHREYKQENKDRINARRRELYAAKKTTTKDDGAGSVADSPWDWCCLPTKDNNSNIQLV